MVTILPKKSQEETPLAKNDEHLTTMMNDPTINQFPDNKTTQQNFNLNAGYNAAQGADILIENTNADWINRKWRPMMGWLYMLVCFCDFVLFPILYAVYITLLYKGMVPGDVPSQWRPLTLEGAGLFHIAMGAVLGIAAYGRTKEKIEGAAK